jgi:hypothetical protein
MLRDRIRGSRWFKRGWTLQELVAPKEVIFYSSEWSKLGSKSGLHELLTEITGIERRVLKDGNFENVSVARRMSWAANRETTRVEDRAYSLLGIFDCNMPLLYGEGAKAFIRLQEEIMKVSDDQSLFAWGVPDEPLSMEDFSDLRGFLETYTHPSYGKQRSLREERLPDLNFEKDLVGLLATSPADFANSGATNMIDDLGSEVPPIVTNKGTRIMLPLFPHAFAFRRAGDVTSARCDTCFDEAWLSFAVIACCIEDDFYATIGIPLLAWSHRSFARLRGAVLIPVSRWPGASLAGLDQIRQTLMIRKPTLSKPRIASSFTVPAMPAESGYALSGLACASHAAYDDSRRVLSVAPEHAGERELHAALYFVHKTQPTFAVVLGGRPAAGLPGGPWASCVLVTRDSPSVVAGDVTPAGSELDVIKASWGALSSAIQRGLAVDRNGQVNPLLARILERKSHKSRTCISLFPVTGWTRSTCVVEIDMAIESVNLVEKGVFVEVNISSKPGQDFDTRRKRRTGFLG